MALNKTGPRQPLPMPELPVEAIDAAALFAALLCTFPRAVTWGNPMHLPNPRKPNGQR